MRCFELRISVSKIDIFIVENREERERKKVRKFIILNLVRLLGENATEKENDS